MSTLLLGELQGSVRGQNRIELNQKFYGHGPSLVNTKSDKSDGLRIGCYDSSIVISG